jgi:cytochrome oxidase Cu insertion factor (SCO1/SenC/PrrC family)
MRTNRFAPLWMVPAAVAVLAGASLAQAPGGDEAPTVLAIGATAPMRDVKMMNVNDKEITLADAAGKKGTLVVFMCNHCPWVKAWQGRIAKIGNAAVAKGIGVVAVNSNDPAAYPEDDLANMKTRAKDLGFKFPYVVDATSDLARTFGATHTPEIFLFDASGKLVYHGAVDDNRDEKAVQKSYLQQAVMSVAAGKSVATAETKSFGCGIKFRGKSES